MNLATDFLAQAEKLVSLDPHRPRQANLRTAISRSYYALFHLLIDAAVTHALGVDRGSPARELRNAMSRWYGHAQMKTTANWFRNSGKVPDEVAALLGFAKSSAGGIVPPDLVQVANAFVELQDARHIADYDVGARLTRSEAQSRVQQVRRAFAHWKAVEGSPVARLFLLMLLTGKAPITSR